MSEHTFTGAARSFKLAGPAHADEETPFVSLADVTEIELLILRQMREMTIGDHRSRSHGSGFDYVGMREWQAGDRFSSIDWAQSSLTDFSPLIVRDFEQPSTATVIAVADNSLSMRCGVDGVPLAAVAARAIATIGLSAVFFQDMFGLVTFDADMRDFQAVAPRIGRNHVIHCLGSYEHRRGTQEVRHAGSLSMTIASFIRRTALVPFVSDFLFDDPESVLKELSLLSSTHDVFVVLLDAAYAFELPRASAGWVEVCDIETGRTRTISRSTAARMSETVRDWQDGVVRAAKDLDLDVVRLGIDNSANGLVLAEFVAERRLRKVT